MGDNGAPVWFWWELPPAERLAARPHISENETRLAIDIDWGRRLLGVSAIFPWDWSDELEPLPDGCLDVVEQYSDAIAAILHAADYVGIDTAEVLEEAWSAWRRDQHQALLAARRRSQLTGGDDAQG